MKARLQIWSQSNQDEERRCAACGTSLPAARQTNQGWSLESLVPAITSTGLDLCPACRQRQMARRIGAVISAHT